MENEECMEGGGEKKVLMGRRRMECQRPVKWSCAEEGGGRGRGEGGEGVRNWAAGGAKGSSGEREGRMEGRVD